MMKFIHILSILIPFFPFCSCIDINPIPYQENDTLIYAAFVPEILIYADHPFQLDIDRDKNDDLCFEFRKWNESLEGIVYPAWSSKVIPLNNLLFSWGAQGSSFIYYIEYGNEISRNKFPFEFREITLAGERFGKRQGVWNLDEKAEGFIAFCREADEGRYYGWLHLSLNDSSILLKEFGFSKKVDRAIRAGEIP